MPILFFLLLLIFIVATWRLHSSSVVKNLRYDPVRWLRGFVIFISFVWLLPLFEKREGLQEAWFLLYFFSVYLSLATMTYGTQWRLHSPLPLISADNAINILALSAIPFVLYYFGSGLIVSDILDITNLSVIERRQVVWESFSEGDRIRLFLGILAYPAAHLWVLRTPQSPLFYWSLLVFSIFIINSVLTSERSVLLFSITVCFLFLHSKYNLSPITTFRKKPILATGIIFILSLLAFYFFVYMPSQRVAGLEDNFRYIFENVAGTEPSLFIEKINDATNGAGGAFALTLGYFSSTLTYFEWFLADSASCMCTHQYGVYNFPFLDNLYGNDWFEIRTQIGLFWNLKGLSGNPWSTAYRDWFIDFGVLGMLVFNIIFFFIIGVIVRSASERSDDFAKFIAAYCTALILMTPLLSPLLVQVISIPFYFITAIFFITSMRCSP